MTVVEMGPKSICIRGEPVPAWFVDERGRRYEFESMAVLGGDGGFALSQLGEGQVVLYPGAIYGLKRLAS